jgi:hypothetical protein
MTTFIKYTVLSIVLQIFLLVVLGLVGSSLSPAVGAVFQIFLTIYEPVIYLVLKLGQFKGESEMIAALWLGLPVAILTYGIILGLVMSYLSRGRTSY